MRDNFMRCLSKVNITDECTKRCIRNSEHIEDHVWVEAENRSDGLPIIIKWGNSGIRRFEYKPILKEEKDQ